MQRSLPFSIANMQRQRRSGSTNELQFYEHLYSVQRSDRERYKCWASTSVRNGTRQIRIPAQEQNGKLCGIRGKPDRLSTYDLASRDILQKVLEYRLPSNLRTVQRPLVAHMRLKKKFHRTLTNVKMMAGKHQSCPQLRHCSIYWWTPIWNQLRKILQRSYHRR